MLSCHPSAPNTTTPREFYLWILPSIRLIYSTIVYTLSRTVIRCSHCRLIHTDSIEADCLLPLPRLSFFAPLVYTPNGVLRTTEIGGISSEPTIRIAAGESVVLSCAPNHFKFQATTSVPATCKTGQTLSNLTSSTKPRSLLIVFP